MTAEQDFESIFHEVDLLLVVDEWKGGQRFETEPAIFQARGFTNVGRSTLPLYQLLAAHGAADWHARGTRAVNPFLFDSKAFDQIMVQIDRADTCLYGYLDRNHAHYSKDGPAAPNWTKIMSERPELARVWDVGSSHARALFWFLECLLRCLQPRLGREIRIRIVVDQQDWLSGRATRLPEFKPGLGLLGGRDDTLHAEALTITDKTAPAVLPYLPFLGLVDSEIWAFGRLLSLQLADGGTVHERYMARSKNGTIEVDEVVIPKAGWDDMFERHHGSHEQLKSYWVTLSNWPTTKNVNLNEALGDLRSDQRWAPPNASSVNFCFLRKEAGVWTI